MREVAMDFGWPGMQFRVGKAYFDCLWCGDEDAYLVWKGGR